MRNQPTTHNTLAGIKGLIPLGQRGSREKFGHLLQPLLDSWCGGFLMGWFGCRSSPRRLISFLLTSHLE
ncbi:hypothetical protein OsI_11342 [Oryza sativa Indica Group]|uniref:Uncharacterized protein n=2 Tax=Oryza sativa TaxID=4530 RepID=B9F865_ORYSJ|nr:hypothetical protein OsI_11342 [Oryza sativa Indica Group]EEE58963.1 hypothetical protein OsJ_10650 [Oryza sativa Japonica Group]